MHQQRYIVTAGLMALVVFNTPALAAKSETCAQIREQIVAQKEVLPKANVDLLQKLSARSDCRFSAAEVYRAAYGSKPFPKSDQQGHRARDDDDD